MNLNDKYENKEMDIENMLRSVDLISGSNQSGFNRENVKNFLDDIKNVLVTKTHIIKSLKFSISKATKVIFCLKKGV